MVEKTLIIVGGPTAVGKTSVAIQLAKYFQSEIISADSRQIYRELNIGTAKPTAAEMAEVPHHFINSNSIHQPYDAAVFGDEALKKINELFENMNQVIMCGGSGLYMKAVVEGFDNIPEIPDEIRAQLTSQFQSQGIAWLQDQMKNLDPEHYLNIDQQNPHRLIRALEVKIGTGMSIASFRKMEKRKHPFKIVKIGLELPREALYQRIDSRMDKMIEDGLFDEAKSLYPYRHHQALQTVGYQEIFDFMDGLYDYNETVRLLKRNSRRYAKRQLTWFKRDADMIWFSPNQLDTIIQFITKSSE